MLPQYFIQIRDSDTEKEKMQKYFDNQYPDTSDCLVLNKQITDITKDLEDIQIRISTMYKESASAGLAGSLYALGNKIRNLAKTYLETKLNDKNAKKTNLKCANNGSLNTETNTNSNTNSGSVLLNDSNVNSIKKFNVEDFKTNKKKYLIFGIITVVLLTGSTIYYIKTKK